MMSLHARRFVVMHLYSTFCGPPEFSFRSKFIPKLQFFVILGAVSPHFIATTVKFGVSVRTLDILPAVNLVKKSLRGICPLGEIFTKNSKFSRFLAT